jgi:hypothetical protein
MAHPGRSPGIVRLGESRGLVFFIRLQVLLIFQAVSKVIHQSMINQTA